ncbi:MAG TPA: hypothetical protein VFB55_13190 [Verrucomicrobiae bacterium]|nr:hypothetical protein [Verrucomicrobiae bacterium]
MKWKWLTAVVAAGGLAVSAGAWDYEGHHVINELALASLPRDFGLELTPAVKSRIDFLAGEPDRWRNVPDLPLEHVNGPDHYLDLEDLPLYGLTPATLPPLRYDFVADIVKARAAHPERFPPIDPAQDADHTRELSGFLPWAICEQYEKLKSDFTVLKVLQRYGGTPEEIANARADCVYVMGVLGHYVGDGSQPLHTTVHHHGWVGSNPRGYTTRRSFHAWIDGGYFKKTGGVRAGPLRAKIRPARRIAHADDPEAFFRGIVNYLVAQNKLVVPLYQLEKDGKLSGEGPQGLEGRAFLENQLVTGAQMLGDIWLTAWLESADDDPYLEKELQQRNQTVAPR